MLERDRGETLDWLNSVIAAVPEKHRAAFLDGILPDQSEDGTFHPNAELRDGSEIDGALKDIVELLGDSIRERLLHEGLAGTEVMVRGSQELEPLIANTRNVLKKRASLSPPPPELRQPSLAMFRWLAQERRWDDLADALPVFTLDSDGSERVSKTSASAAAILAPRELWPEAAQSYWDAFPSGTVLIGDYASLLDAELWREAAENEVVVTDLLWTQEAELSDLEQYTRDLELEGDEHSAGAPVRVSELALVGTEAFYNAVRGSRERAARFLQFILNYVVEADPSWRETGAGGVRMRRGARHHSMRVAGLDARPGMGAAAPGRARAAQRREPRAPDKARRTARRRGDARRACRIP
jgi:hypothetical protein